MQCFYYARFLLLALLSIILAACMVGPNFHNPPPPPVTTYNAEPLPHKTVSTPGRDPGLKSQTYVENLDIPRAWWELFHSRELNALIRAGLINSPNLEAAFASLRQAQEALNVQIGNSLFPAVNLQLSAQRQKISLSSFGSSFASSKTGTTSSTGSSSTTSIPTSSIFNTFNATVNVSYTLDIFGGARRQIEALAAQVNYQEYLLIAAYLTLTTNIVTTAITIGSLEDQITATKELIKLETQSLNLLKKQYKLGAISLINVLTQETLVEQSSANLPPLQKSLAQAKHALAVLVGAFPSEIAPSFKLSRLNLPKNLPVSLPSRLVQQRPDVGAKAALLHAASAQIGVATANLLPQFTVTGDYGWSASKLANFFSPANKIWSITTMMTQPLFQGGALFAARRQAIAAYDAAFAQYRQTVLQAFQNVADVLRALETDARTLRAQELAEKAAEKNLFLAKNQYLNGKLSYLDLVIVQVQYDQTKIARIQAEATRYTDTAALFQALGGGWWNGTGFCITNTC